MRFIYIDLPTWTSQVVVKVKAKVIKSTTKNTLSELCVLYAITDQIQSSPSGFPLHGARTLDHTPFLYEIHIV